MRAPRSRRRRSMRSYPRSIWTMLPISEVPSAHRAAVGIAERDPSAHRDQLVDEEQAVLEHLLEDQDLAVGLRGERERDRGQVGRERGPGAVLELRDRVADVGLDP